MKLDLQKSFSIDELFQLEETLYSHESNKINERHDQLALTLFDSAFRQTDFESCWEIIRIVDGLKSDHKWHKDIKLRQVHLMRLAGHVTECLKLIDYCLLQLPMSETETNSLLWEKQLLNFYITLDFEGLVASSQHSKAFFSGFQNRSQVFLIGSSLKSQTNIDWSWERIVSESTDEELYENQNLVSACEFIDTLRRSNDHQLRNIFKRDIESLLSRLNLYDRLLTLCAIVRILRNHKYELPTAAVYQQYRSISLELTNHQSPDITGLLPDLSRKNPFTSFLTRSKHPSFKLKEKALSRNFHHFKAALSELTGRLSIRVLSVGLSQKDKEQMRRASLRRLWKKILKSTRATQGDIEQNFIEHTFVSCKSFSECETFLEIYNDTSFLDFQNLMNANQMEGAKFESFSIKEKYRNPYEQVYALYSNGKGSFQMRLPIFQDEELLRHTPADYRSCSSILSDINHFSAMRSEANIEFAQILEFNTHYALTPEYNGHLISEIWKSSNRERLQEVYLELLKFNWSILMENGLLNGNILPFEVVVSDRNDITILNSNKSTVLKRDVLHSLLALLPNLIQKSSHDIEFFGALKNEVRLVNDALVDHLSVQIQILRLLEWTDRKDLSHHILKHIQNPKFYTPTQKAV